MQKTVKNEMMQKWIEYRKKIPTIEQKKIIEKESMEEAYNTLLLEGHQPEDELWGELMYDLVYDIQQEKRKKIIQS